MALAALPKYTDSIHSLTSVILQIDFKSSSTECQIFIAFFLSSAFSYCLIHFLVEKWISEMFVQTK